MEEAPESIREKGKITMFKIYWRSVITGATGHGTGSFTKEQAEQIVKQWNEQYKGVLEHWYQPA